MPSPTIQDAAFDSYAFYNFMDNMNLDQNLGYRFPGGNGGAQLLQELLSPNQIGHEAVEAQFRCAFPSVFQTTGDSLSKNPVNSANPISGTSAVAANTANDAANIQDLANYSSGSGSGSTRYTSNYDMQLQSSSPTTTNSSWRSLFQSPTSVKTESDALDMYAFTDSQVHNAQNAQNAHHNMKPLHPTSSSSSSDSSVLDASQWVVRASHLPPVTYVQPAYQQQLEQQQRQQRVVASSVEHRDTITISPSYQQQPQGQAPPQQRRSVQNERASTTFPYPPPPPPLPLPQSHFQFNRAPQQQVHSSSGESSSEASMHAYDENLFYASKMQQVALQSRNDDWFASTQPTFSSLFADTSFACPPVTTKTATATLPVAPSYRNERQSQRSSKGLPQRTRQHAAVAVASMVAGIPGVQDSYPWKCDQCDKSFQHQSNLKIHAVIHTAKALVCPHCPKKFARKSNLTQHLRVHTGEKPFKCDLCAATFKQKHSLKDHMKKHSGEKPFQCEFCHKTFTVKHNYTVHVRKHTGEKPYSCKMCCKRFSKRKECREHEKACGMPNARQHSMFASTNHNLTYSY